MECKQEESASGRTVIVRIYFNDDSEFRRVFYTLVNA